MKSTEPNKNRPGRRAQVDADEVRQGLLDTARRLFAEQGYEAVSVRTLAAESGVNAAMIHYYFGNKQGLYLAVLQEALAPSLQGLAQLAEHPGDDLQAMRGLLQNHMQLLVREAWIAPLVAREIVLRDGPLQDAFAEQIAARFREGMRDMITNTDIAHHSGDQFAMLTVLSLTIFPFLARMMVEKVFDLPVDQDFAERWSEHVSDLILTSQLPDHDAPSSGSAS